MTFLVKRKYCRNFAASKEQKNMKHLNSKEVIAIWFAIVAAIISITALWMPPVGIIDETVLVLIGQFLLFIATLIGVHRQTPSALAGVFPSVGKKPCDEGKGPQTDVS